MVKGFDGVITHLKPEQAEYINVPQQGPYKAESYRY
jgi:adenosylhomocysteinase